MRAWEIIAACKRMFEVRSIASRSCLAWYSMCNVTSRSAPGHYCLMTIPLFEIIPASSGDWRRFRSDHRPAMFAYIRKRRVSARSEEYSCSRTTCGVGKSMWWLCFFAKNSKVPFNSIVSSNPVGLAEGRQNRGACNYSAARTKRLYRCGIENHDQDRSRQTSPASRTERTRTHRWTLPGGWWI